MNIAEAHAFFEALALQPEQATIAGRVLVEIQQRLKFLNDVGLEYLTLDRLSSTLSGGEAQRIQLATCLGSRLVGACYVLDEPSIGLHSRDTAPADPHPRRTCAIWATRSWWSSTIADVMRAADHIVDMGPGAGENGGQVIFEGTLSELVRNGKDAPAR